MCIDPCGASCPIGRITLRQGKVAHKAASVRSVCFHDSRGDQAHQQAKSIAAFLLAFDVSMDLWLKIGYDLLLRFAEKLLDFGFGCTFLIKGRDRPVVIGRLMLQTMLKATLMPFIPQIDQAMVTADADGNDLGRNFFHRLLV